MPKTKDAFALRDFDTTRILQRDWFFRYEQALNKKLTFDIPADTNDNDVLEKLRSNIVRELKNNQYSKAQLAWLRLKYIAKAIEVYFDRLVRHTERLKKYNQQLEDYFFTEIAKDNLHSALSFTTKQMKKKLLLDENFDVILRAVGELTKKFFSCLTSMTYELKGQYRANFSSRLKQARKDAGFTQAVFANRIGINQSSYAQYENGGREPSLDRLVKIAKVLNCSTDWLLGLE